LSLARADAGRESLEFRRLDLGETVRRTALDWRQAMATHQLRFTENIIDRDLFIAGDKTAVPRLLNILLDNAIKYTPAWGSVDLALEEKDDKAVITVRDSGIGIGDQDQTRIFERFYRADKARSRELGGAGLGLAIAQWIVDQHQGSIKVQSSPGRGSVFFVELPLQHPTDTHSPL